ncbi:MAG: HAD-IIIC family phosphatase [Chloroflexota bacterium]
MSAADLLSTGRIIKCVVWDLDNTLWQGVAVEDPNGAVPSPDQSILDIMSELEKRGIVNSVASRNDPVMLERLLADPVLHGKFIVPQVSWDPKSTSIRKIAAHLNIGLDALAFVDDSAFERAEVSYMLPEVVVLAPEEMAAAIGTLAFNPGQLTAEGERRAEMYRHEEQRKEAEAGFAGTRADFLRWCDMRLTITPATEADLPRIIELTERTHQLNSTGRRYSADEVKERVGAPRWLVPVARLRDRFGDYGTIGAAIVDTQAPWPPDVWLAEIVMLSCRVEGRGIPAALLRWIMGRAQDAGMKSLRAVYRVNEQNLPVRLLFKQMGFTKLAGDDFVTVARDLSQPLPAYPDWLHISTPEASVTG